MAKLNIYDLFATALVLIQGRRFWMRPLFADKAASCAYQGLVLKMKEIERQICMSPNRFHHLLELTKPMIMKKNAIRAPIHPVLRVSQMAGYSC